MSKTLAKVANICDGDRFNGAMIAINSVAIVLNLINSFQESNTRAIVGWSLCMVWMLTSYLNWYHRREMMRQRNIVIDILAVSLTEEALRKLENEYKNNNV